MIKELKYNEEILPYRCGDCYCLNKDGSTTKIATDKTHRSIDTCSLNIHIVPKVDEGSIAECLNELIKNLHESLKEEITSEPGSGKEGRINGFKGNYPVEKCVIQEKDGYNYLLAYEQIICSKYKTIDSILGKLQYYRYKKGTKVNTIDADYLMYPNPQIGYRFDEASGHCIYNENAYSVYDQDKIEEIKKRFEEFMNGGLIDFNTGKPVESKSN